MRVHGRSHLVQLLNTRNIMIQFIEKQSTTFCFTINSKRYYLIKCNLYYQNDLLSLKANVKGSTLGWYIQRKFVSYNQLKKAIIQSTAFNHFQ